MAAALFDRVADAAGAGVAGALLAIELAGRAGDFATGERLHGALPLVGMVHHQRLLQQGSIDFSAEFLLIDLKAADLLAFLVGPGGWDRTPDSLVGSQAGDWTQIRERMNFIVDLFRSRHLDPTLFSAPYTPEQQIALLNGVRYAYVGNVHDPECDSTSCHSCGTPLIGRDWFELTRWGLGPDGRCPSCHTPCAGVFEAEPGDWGRKRPPVRLAGIA